MKLIKSARALHSQVFSNVRSLVLDPRGGSTVRHFGGVSLSSDDLVLRSSGLLACSDGRSGITQSWTAAQKPAFEMNSQKASWQDSTSRASSSTQLRISRPSSPMLEMQSPKLHCYQAYHAHTIRYITAAAHEMRRTSCSVSPSIFPLFSLAVSNRNRLP